MNLCTSFTIRLATNCPLLSLIGINPREERKVNWTWTAIYYTTGNGERMHKLFILYFSSSFKFICSYVSFINLSSVLAAALLWPGVKVEPLSRKFVFIVVRALPLATVWVACRLQLGPWMQRNGRQHSNAATTTAWRWKDHWLLDTVGFLQRRSCHCSLCGEIW